jgi:protein-serine/threonine kinase
VNSSPSVNPATASIEYQRGVPPVAPPRTSSNQRSGAALAAASAADRSRRNEQARNANTGDGPQDRVDSGRRRQVNGNEREILNDDAAAAAAREASRSRRREQQSPHAAQPQRANSSREPRSAEATQGRSQAKTNAPTATPNGLSREGSEILNRLVVSKPEVDLERERERERMAEAQAPSATSDDKPSSGLNVVGSEGVDDAGRGGSRSRHENTTSSKREKNMRFGEYYLGNTLGEGEFGKVKMGWKQEGGVQVSMYECMASETAADNREGGYQTHSPR